MAEVPRISAILLPTLLFGDRSMSDQKSGSGLHHWIRLEIAKFARLPQAPCEHDGKRNLVQLNAAPIGGPINPEVLREASIRLLRAR